MLHEWKTTSDQKPQKEELETHWNLKKAVSLENIRKQKGFLRRLESQEQIHGTYYSTHIVRGILGMSDNIKPISKQDT